MNDYQKKKETTDVAKFTLNCCLCSISNLPPDNKHTLLSLWPYPDMFATVYPTNVQQILITSIQSAQTVSRSKYATSENRWKSKFVDRRIPRGLYPHGIVYSFLINNFRQTIQTIGSIFHELFNSLRFPLFHVLSSVSILHPCRFVISLDCIPNCARDQIVSGVFKWHLEFT